MGRQLRRLKGQTCFSMAIGMPSKTCDLQASSVFGGVEYIEGLRVQLEALDFVSVLRTPPDLRGNEYTEQTAFGFFMFDRSNWCVAKHVRFRRSAQKEAWFTRAQFTSGYSAFIAPNNSGHTTFSANQVTLRYFACKR